MFKWIEWFFSETEKPIIEDTDVYGKLLDLEEKYQALLQDVKRLEEENIETSNCLYELMTSLDAVDARIDILTVEKWVEKDV